MADWKDHQNEKVVALDGKGLLCLSQRGSRSSRSLRANGAGCAAAVGEGSRYPLRDQCTESNSSLFPLNLSHRASSWRRFDLVFKRSWVRDALWRPAIESIHKRATSAIDVDVDINRMVYTEDQCFQAFKMKMPKIRSDQERVGARASVDPGAYGFPLHWNVSGST